ncbi:MULTISPECIES: excinuclease ABC subunit UvrA [unclassified Mucilaginibacter]|uniref:excinuclease ABC subunit UvrA n=1 Tax=unclassified Mucilaginibacter TaxID=2617802 RepID=UPI002AC99C2A|nr:MULTISPECIES: excinuclease ABC subunit UvrA [unclassified Mucilaginibacter]MEB0261207.1 excinuclease ABC subunit UvrA [Mucilaginibacter sp. 10I4]MEB0280380.1 excinuclease ABC subunit UvrA [Mucilaginibacter sp. 10B2]MEB0300401.1 excinuclease ABC subunit UvrA [Mucilaginibacter sp. 5C4]WPX25700.1 excinuclease ABC subunit UvrA [Mucilaginibacter sp. 5C4]
MTKEAEKDPKKHIIIKGARVHNLKNMDVAIPKNKLVVITGMSGSGKSSLAFDTLYAEGQRRYVESLSSYARQFLGRMNKPDVDYIKGIAPAIAIEQKVITSNPRSTVGTSTEIYDYLKLLFSRIGKTISPISGGLVKRDSVTDVINFITALPDESQVTILCPLHPHNNRSIKEELAVLMQKGFVRVEFNGQVSRIETLLEDETIDGASMVMDEEAAPAKTKKTKAKKGEEEVSSLPAISVVRIVIDRITKNEEDETISRLADSIQTAFFEGKGDCYVQYVASVAPSTSPPVGEILNYEALSSGEGLGGASERFFCDRFELDNIRFEEPTPNFFSFNNPYGACKKCEGYGKVIGIDADLVIPDKSKSIYEGAIAPWRGEKMREWNDLLVKSSLKFDFPIHRQYNQLTEKEQELLWTGNQYFRGLNAFFKEMEEQTYKIQYRVLLSRYRGKTTCPECKGSRLRKDATYVKIDGRSITDVVLMPLDTALEFFSNLKLNETDAKIGKRLLLEIVNRLVFLNDVGLAYLTLNRLSNTLSGGESQRINLATSLGSSLVGSIYVLDEPSIGLHPRDTQRLITVLKSLRDVGNTVLVVEHEEEIMKAADHIIDIGPEAGTHGGNLMFTGTYDQIIVDNESLTGKYLSGREEIAIPTSRRKWSDYIEIKGARENNLKNADAKFPLGILTVVTGVSGSGKTSLVKRIFAPALQKTLGNYNGDQSGAFDSIEGDYNKIEQVEIVDQNPIGRSSRSNPVTYVKAWDEIRNLYAALPVSKAAGLKPSAFSFNVEGGRCDVCQGEGEVKIEMQFMADIFLTCEACNGKRFKQHILDITYNEKNVSEVLEMTIDEGLEFFVKEPKILAKIKPLVDVGLGYVQLGQSSNTLSGGEAQRIKLASFLVKGNNTNKTLFIFDEPTTGLHFADIKKLLKSFDALLEHGNTIIVIEHNMDVIKCADWVIDIGPEGGDRGGKVVFEGLPEDLIKVKNSYTGQFLKERF